MAVYFIRQKGTNLIKIGSAKDPTERMKSLQTGSPHEFELLAVGAGGAREEHAMHRRFVADHVRGEWFRMSADIAVAVALCNPEFARMATLEPRLLDGARAAGSVELEDGRPFCAAAAWYGYSGHGVKDHVTAFVGWLRKDKSNPDLCGPEAYDVVYDVLSKILPDCRGCNCVSGWE
ncbi:MAG: GIY-YIG nuclease family protein [Gemmata sp.]